jgi:predicted metal-dependent TIM-barrel fold hydrolase
LQFVKGSQTAIVFLKAGNIVHAERGALRDAEALYEIAAWEAIEFAYDQYVRAPAETISPRWDELLVAAVTRRKNQSVGATPSVSQSPAEPPPPANPKGRWGLFGGARK